jgi:hypothetical protein
MKKLQLGFLAICLAGAMSAHAAMIQVWNTGVDGAGAVLPDGTISDPHYSLISVPGGTTAMRVRSAAGGWPIPPYIGDNTLSRWIGPNNDTQLNGPVGNYTYRTTFDLTGFNPATATISGGWTSDNNGVGIYLNGNLIAGPTSFTQFSAGFVSFAGNAGFVPGVNTLDFVLYNGGGPTALRVEMTGQATPVPEPSTVIAGALLLLPFGASTMRILRNRKSA